MKKTVDEKMDELAGMVAQGFSEIRETMATKQDLADLRAEMKQDFKEFKGEIEVTLDHHIGVVRKDYDSLAGRVKTLEQTVFAK